MDFVLQFINNIPDVLTGWVIPILFVLTLVVFFHELGHFLTARWCNVKVDAFSIGFGHEIFGFTDKLNTRWKFCWIPLGGYVKFAGDASAASTPDNEQLNNLNDTEKSEYFHFKPLWQRALVVAAGPIASFLLGIVIFAGMFYINKQSGPSGYIEKVIEGSAAQEAGLKPGDIITHINGEETPFFSDIFRIVSLSANDKLTVSVNRGGELGEVILTPRVAMIDNGFGREISVGRIGVAPTLDKTKWTTRDYTFPGAVIAAVNQTKFIITSTLGYIKKLLTFKEKADKLSGPVGIGKMINQFSEVGFSSLLYLAGLLSVSIGLFNLFPIPLLDGGHLMFYAIEALTGKPPSERFMEYSFRAGFALLIGLMLFTTMLDIGL